MTSFDPKCLELAEHFLKDDPEGRWTERETRELAAEIQQTVEDFMHGPKT